MAAQDTTDALDALGTGCRGPAQDPGPLRGVDEPRHGAGGRRLTRGGNGQTDAEDGVARHRLYSDCAVVLLGDDPPNHVQPEPRALALWLGRVEGFEDAVQVFRRD